MKQRIISLFSGWTTRRFVVRLTFMLATVATISCETEKQEAVLSRDEVVKVLTEIYVAEDKIQKLSITPDSGRRVFNLMREGISEKTGIPDSVFQRSMEYYIKRPDDLEKIYAALVDSLNLREQRTPETP